MTPTYRVYCQGQVSTLGQVGKYKLVATCQNCEHRSSLQVEDLISRHGESCTLSEVLRRLKCQYCRHRRSKDAYSVVLTVDDEDTVKRMAGGRKGFLPGKFGRFEWLSADDERVQVARRRQRQRLLGY
ncbi:MAG: hypothetical protein E6Q98_02880 [Rhodospirillaceae bacterium]|nr:MAG: hypothetical protein E6Q98_02880 [Rhodospirillaceae bacterium]